MLTRTAPPDTPTIERRSVAFAPLELRAGVVERRAPLVEAAAARQRIVGVEALALARPQVALGDHSFEGCKHG